jgi:hypothetical protein
MAKRLGGQGIPTNLSVVQFEQLSFRICACSTWAASGRSSRSRRIAKSVRRSTTRAFIASFSAGKRTAVLMPSSRLVRKLRQDHRLDITVIHGDGTTTAAKKGGDNVGFSGHKKIKGDKVVALCDRHCNVIAPFELEPLCSPLQTPVRFLIPTYPTASLAGHLPYVTTSCVTGGQLGLRCSACETERLIVCT